MNRQQRRDSALGFAFGIAIVIALTIIMLTTITTLGGWD